MRKKYHIEGIDCANCAAKVEKKMNELPDVEVTLTFATSQLMVDAENPDEVLIELRKIADKMEPGTVIEEISKTRKHGGKKKSHHHDDDCCDDDCCHGKHDGHEHHHHHGEDCCDDDCCCGEHKEHEHHYKHLEGVAKKKYRIEGIDCANCAAKVEKKMNELPDVAVTLTFATSQLLVEAKNPDEVLPKLREIADKMEPGTVIEEYSSEKEKSVEADEDGDDDVKLELIKIVTGAFVFIGGVVCQKYLNAMPAVYIALFVVSYVILGGEVVLKAVKNLFRGKVFDENFLMSIATIGAFATGEYPEAVGVMLFYEIGELFEDIAVGKSRKQIMEAVDMRPEIVRYVDGNNVIELAPEEIEVGDVIEVRPGDRIPLDGVIIKGDSRIDTSAVTGEPVPVGVKEGSEAVSGCVNMSGVIYVKVEKILEESMVSRILEAVENAAASKPKIDRFISKFARVYTPIVVFAALATAVIPSLITGNWHYWIYTALTFLVISCPCALGLATPVAIMVGNGVGAKNGIMFKTAVSLEQTGKMQTVALDKTGTITEGEPKVTDIITGDRIPQNELIAIAYGLERKSEHPLAKAVVNYVEESGDKNSFAEEVTDFKAVAGNGLKGMLDTNVVAGGNLKFISEYCNISDDLRNKADDLSSEGKTPLFFARNNKLLGIIAVADTIKKDSPQAIRELQNMGIRVVMITGDNERSAKAIGKLAGVDEVIAGVLPEGKEKEIARLKEQGSVIMVGDGINDAPALTRADIGIAIGAGTDVAIDAADIVLMKNRLSDVPAAIRLSKRTLTNIHENLFWAFFYNCIGIPLAAGAWIPVFGWTLNPMFGAAAMSLSSFCVVTNALRLNLIKIYDTGKDHIYKEKSSKNKNKTTKGDKTMTKTMNIEGMMCGHCEATVKKALEAVDGVTEAVVSHENGTAVVTLSKEVDNDVLKKAVEDKDYKVTAVK